MNNFLKTNKLLFAYSLIIFLIIPFFGINFVLNLFGNILLLLFLIPLLLLLVAIIGFNSYKSKINKCENCGAFSFGISETCINCGADLGYIDNDNNLDKKPSERTIEVKAEELD